MKIMTQDKTRVLNFKMTYISSARRALDDLDKSSGMWPTMIGVMAEQCRKIAQDYKELRKLEKELQKYEGEAISNGREDNI